ncbi:MULTISPECIES: hypothetical protein [Amycolatopsis]|uniref:PPE family domain-containing protein n=1 Tax=Amycolatopsis albidoflavus TaxID=102226 RepID=A0ABW5HVI2_9PSEU
MGFLQTIEDAGHWIGDRVDDLGKFASTLLHGDPGPEALPASELVQKVLTGPGTASWHSGAEQANTLSNRHNEASDLLSRVNAGLESAWTGRGADEAKARIRRFAETTAVSAAIYGINGSNLTDIAHGFDALKSSLEQMPPAPPHLNFFDRISPWETDTEKEISYYNALAQHNVDRYQAYVQHSDANGEKLQTDYGQLDSFGGQDIVNGPNPGQAPPEKRPDTGPQHKRTGLSPYELPSSSDTPSPAHSSDGVSGPHVAHGPDRTAWPSAISPPGSIESQTAVSGWAPPPSNSTMARNCPPAPTTTDAGESGSGSTPWSPIPVQGGRGTVGNVGRNTGESNRAGEPRSPTGSPARPGAGRGTGAEGRAATNTAGGASATQGKTGSRGTPGMAGTTPPRDKDKTEDPQEHRRKYGLDTDSAFSLTDDDGERTVDPRTGLPPTPPTIGG